MRPFLVRVFWWHSKVNEDWPCRMGSWTPVEVVADDIVLSRTEAKRSKIGQSGLGEIIDIDTQCSERLAVSQFL